MQEIVFNILGQDYPIIPYYIEYDGNPDYRRVNWLHIGDPPGQEDILAYNPLLSYFSSVEETGYGINVKEILRSEWLRLRKAGVDYRSDTYTMCNIMAKHGEATYDMSIYYYVEYSHLTPNNIKLFIMTNKLDGFDGENLIINPSNVYLSFNYTEDIIEDKLYIFAQKLINCPPEFLEWEGSISLYIGIRDGVRNVRMGWGLVEPILQELEFYDVSIEETENSDPTANTYGINPVYPEDPYYVMYWDHHGYANLSNLIYEAGGYCKLNTYVFDEIKIDNVDWNDDTNQNSQNSFVPPSPYGDNPFYRRSDYIPTDGLPIYDALATGFCRAYLMTTGDLKNLANFLLTDDFLQNVKNLFQNPIDYILSLMALPVAPTDTTSEHVKIGGVEVESITSERINKSFIEVDLGSVQVPELWRAFIDYSPATRLSIYLPFIGIQEINIDDVCSRKGGSINVKYRIDVLTGIFVCSLTISNSDKGVNGVMYNYEGTMGYQIPIFETDVTQKLGAIKMGAGAAVSLLAGNVGALPAFAGSMIEATISKPSVKRAGSLSGDSGFLGNYTPYLIIEFPEQALPKLFASQKGYASNYSGKVSDFSGYLEVDTIDLSGIACTEAEKDLILQAFKEGVFI